MWNRLEGFFTSPCGVKQYTLSENRSRSFFKKAHELFIVGHVSLPLQDLAQPVQLLFLTVAGRGLSLPSEASLYFQWAAIPYSAVLCISKVRIWISKRLSVWSDQRSMQRLIHVCLGHRNIILETSPESACTSRGLRPAPHNSPSRYPPDTHCKQVINLVDGLMLVLHLL